MICIICGKSEEGHGHNAEPVGDGRCCEDCKNNRVIPEMVRENHRRLREKSKLTSAIFSNDFCKDE